MIIKSMSRKQPSFQQLYDYIVRDNDNDTDYNFTHNCFGTDREDILQEFYDNSDLLKKRMGSNYLYHEIISITRSRQLTEQQQKKLLREITQQYINARAKDCLVFAGLHDEKDNQLHYHLIISANKVDVAKRYYHSKQNFEEIKVRLEGYVLQHYPQLEQEKLISENKQLDKNGQRVKSTHANKREGKYVRRTGKMSKKQQTAERIKAIFNQSQSIAEYTNRLREENIESYVRGKTMGFVVDGRKHRINTLGIAEEFDEMLLRFEEQRRENQKPAEENKKRAETGRNTDPKQQTKDEQQASNQKTQSSDQLKENTYDDMVAKRMAELNKRYQQQESAEQDNQQGQNKGRSR